MNKKEEDKHKRFFFKIWCFGFTTILMINIAYAFENVDIEYSIPELITNGIITFWFPVFVFTIINVFVYTLSYYIRENERK